MLKKFKFKTDKAPDLKKYVGKTIQLPGVKEPVKIKTIVGNIWTPTSFEINAEHLVNMLRFFKIMNNDKSITEEQIKAFGEIDFHVEKVPTTPKRKEWPV